MYQDELKEAIRRTKRLGLELPPFIIEEETYLDKPQYQHFDQVLLNCIPESMHERMAHQCFDIHNIASEPLSEFFDSNVLFTLGYVNINGNRKYYNTEDDLKNLLNRTVVNSATLDLHAWITLPSMEIIDATIGSTAAKEEKNGSVHKFIFNGHPNNFKDDFSYHPMLVGYDFINRLNKQVLGI